jgi:translation initiation factor IF-3
VQFRGREIAHADLGKKLLMRFAEDLTAHGTVEGVPRLEGRNAHILISPVKSGSGVKPAPAEKPPLEKPRQAAGPVGPSLPTS